MIAKNDEVKRSQIWRIVMTVSSVLIIVGAVLLLRTGLWYLRFRRRKKRPVWMWI